MRRTTIERMTAATEDPEDAVAMTIGGVTWIWVDSKSLFLRMKRSAIPSAFQSDPDKDAVEFLGSARAYRPKTPPLPIERGDQATLGSFAVEDRILGMVEHENGDVDWHVWGQTWFIARDRSGDLVAVWKMPEGAGALEMFLTEYQGLVWGCTPKMALMLAIPDDREAAATLRREARRTSGTYAEALAKNIALAAAGTVAPIVDDEHEGVAKVGPRSIPFDQVKMIRALAHGANLEWTYSGARDPVGAKLNGVMVAIVMPIGPVENARGGSA